MAPTTAVARPIQNGIRRAPAPAARSAVNVGDTERVLSAVGGGALAIYGLSRGSLLGAGMALLGGAFVYRGLAGHCPCYASLEISTAEPRGAAASVAAGHGTKVEKTFTVNRPPEELYRFWRNFEALPRVFRHLESVTTDGLYHSRWVAKGPLATRVEWEAEVINEKPNELIAWRSLEGSVVDHAGSIHFTRAPAGRGTEVRVVMKYDPPGGKIGSGIAWLLGEEPSQQIQEDLRRFKQLMETGEMATTEGQTSCRAI
jgi:uncharacterized membrane protein